MPTRRDFLRNVTAGAAWAGVQSRPPPVVLSGRRVKTVDVHAHCVVPEALALLNVRVDRGEALALEGAGLAQRLAAMDAQGIDVSVLCINPNWYDASLDIATRVVALQN